MVKNIIEKPVVFRCQNCGRVIINEGLCDICKRIGG